jgi:NTP pyrophosphohydrolases including oxidative damage repair enzymes
MTKLSDDTRLTETLVNSETLLQGSFLHVRRDTVRQPDGRLAQREYVVHPGAVVVIPLADDDRVVVERQYRHPVGRVMLEFPAGKLDPGEDPLRCGQRELLEETGYRAAQWARAGALHLAIAYSTEVIHIYFARGLRGGERKLDDGEFLDVHLMPVDELLAACRKGDVTDAKTLSCCLWLQNVRDGAWQLDWQDA